MMMIKVLITDELIAAVLPNSLVSVDDESPLAVKVADYADAACRWLSHRLLGEFVPQGDVLSLSERAVTLRALIMALPALDLVATPTGFGVVSSNSLAPASKDRVRALAESLVRSLDDVLVSLQSSLMSFAGWRDSTVGAAFCSSCLCRLHDAERFAAELKDAGDIFDRFARVSALASMFEAVLADNYVGHPLMSSLRASLADGSLPESHPVLSALRTAEMVFVGRQLIGGAPARCPDPHQVWHLVQPMIRRLPDFNDLYQMYLEHVGQAAPKDFVNSRRGGYFF